MTSGELELLGGTWERNNSREFTDEKSGKVLKSLNLKDSLIKLPNVHGLRVDVTEVTP
jgi:hypothetical protein